MLFSAFIAHWRLAQPDQGAHSRERRWNFRLVRCRLNIPGFRSREVILVTTLLDSVQYPPSALSQLYYRRWVMELTLRNLKNTLQMEHLSCQSPEHLEREIRMHFLIHNLVRRLMLESARRYRVLTATGALADTGENIVEYRRFN
ncbi:MAG: transposase [Candidatus Omnitrophica bacterium]|nr:transposase [Candidatus Omnitrophota bacterium]